MCQNTFTNFTSRVLPSFTIQHPAHSATVQHTALHRSQMPVVCMWAIRYNGCKNDVCRQANRSKLQRAAWQVAQEGESANRHFASAPHYEQQRGLQGPAWVRNSTKSFHRMMSLGGTALLMRHLRSCGLVHCICDTESTASCQVQFRHDAVFVDQ